MYAFCYPSAIHTSVRMKFSASKRLVSILFDTFLYEMQAKIL